MVNRLKLSVLLFFPFTVKAQGSINLGTLTISQGFSINAANDGDGLGYSTRYAGDINNDGIPDILIGAIGASGGDGASYVIFGSSSGFSDINLASLTSTQGFSIYSTVYENSGYSVSAAGDVNDDDIDDMIIGAPVGDGVAYVIFGQTNWNLPDNALKLDALTSTQGFSITGYYGAASFGTAVSGAGDFNNDGIDDLIIGAPGSSVCYLIFGTSNPVNIDLANGISASQGFIITASSSASGLGNSVSGAGDVNHDGYSDIIIYAYGGSYYTPAQSSVGYVIFGGSNTATISLNSLSSTQGFSITTTATCDYNSFGGGDVSAAGDVNKDGFDDVLIGNPCTVTESYSVADGYQSYGFAGTAYLVYGNQTTSLSNINVANTPNGWVEMEIFIENAKIGYSVSGAGDFNGDGYADMIIGAPYANGNEGISYLVFGGKNLPSNIDLGSVFNGIIINGGSCSTSCQTGFSVSTGGDINQDGLQDVLLGAPYFTSSQPHPSATFVVYGYIPPTTSPTFSPSLKPTYLPSPLPTILPTVAPSTVLPSSQPTSHPSAPTAEPTQLPTAPTYVPTQLPTKPTPVPSVTPTKTSPTLKPSLKPTDDASIDSTDSSNSSDGLSSGGIAGIVICVLCTVGLCFYKPFRIQLIAFFTCFNDCTCISITIPRSNPLHEQLNSYP